MYSYGESANIMYALTYQISENITSALTYLISEDIIMRSHNESAKTELK